MTEREDDGTIRVRQPTIFLDLSIAPKGTSVPDDENLPRREQAETVLYEQALQPLLAEEHQLRDKEIRTISEHMEISLNAIIDRVQVQFAEILDQKESGSEQPGLEGRIRMLEDRLDELNNRLESRRLELAKEGECSVSNVQHLGSAWILPHPERETPTGKRMVSDPEIEKIAVEAVMRVLPSGFDTVPIKFWRFNHFRFLSRVVSDCAAWFAALRCIWLVSEMIIMMIKFKLHFPIRKQLRNNATIR